MGTIEAQRRRAGSMTGNEWIVPATVVLVASSLAAVTDASKFKVHNLLTFPLALSGLMYHTTSHGTTGFFFALAGLGAGLGVLLVPYLVGGLGAGDVKFFAAVSAWLGTPPMASILIVACLATGVYSAVMVVRQAGIVGLWRAFQAACIQLASLRRGTAAGCPTVQDVLAKEPQYRRRLVPFTAMIAVGVLTVVVRYAVWAA